MELQTKDLDESEMLQLAILASQQDRHDQAITYLKNAIQKNPQNAKVVYFLAAEHAQIGLYERAIQGMEHALEIDPDMYTARFQLGMLYLTSGLVESSLKTLEPLANLGEDNFFGCFSLGLAHLIRDEFAECRRFLEKGISINHTNLPLNGDMQRILDLIRDKTNDEANAASTDGKVSDSQTSGNLWLSEYQKDNSQSH